jgi:hypothetical protein
MHSHPRMRIFSSYRALLVVSLQVVLLQMNQVSAFSSCHRLRPFAGAFVQRVSVSPIKCPARFRTGDRFFRMGPMDSGKPGEPEPEKVGFWKIIQRVFSRGNDGDQSRRRFIRIGAALAIPFLALETWNTMDPKSLSRRTVLAQSAIVEAITKPSIASSDSKLAPNEVNTIRYFAHASTGRPHSRHTPSTPPHRRPAAGSSATTSLPSSSSTPLSPPKTSSP